MFMESSILNLGRKQYVNSKPPEGLVVRDLEKESESLIFSDLKIPKDYRLLWEKKLCNLSQC